MINENKISSAAFDKKRVGLLIVDDSDLIRERLITLFKNNENISTILQAKNSSEAYDLFNSFSPDIVILDIRIPGDNGIVVLEKLKKINHTVKVIMLTSYPYEQYRRKSMELGADYFFEKSGDMNRIIEVCNKLIVNRIKLMNIKNK